MHEQRRRMREPGIFETRRAGDAVAPGERRALVVLGRELAGDVAGADAQLHHDRRVARLRQLEALLHHADDGGQVGPRIEQPHRRFQRVGVGALLDHARAFAVVLAEDDHHAADHAGRGKVRERVGRHVGADDRFPGDGAAQRIVDRRAEHGGGRRLVGAGLDMHAEVGEQVLGLDHHVEQVRHRRALVAADIAHAGLQQRLGDREDAFAAEHVAVAQRERFHFLLERAFHGGFLGGVCCLQAITNKGGCHSVGKDRPQPRPLPTTRKCSRGEGARGPSCIGRRICGAAEASSSNYDDDTPRPCRCRRARTGSRRRGPCG